MPEIATHVDIDADALLVWDILMDFATYQRWNPLLRSVRGAADRGLGKTCFTTRGSPYGTRINSARRRDYLARFVPQLPTWRAFRRHAGKQGVIHLRRLGVARCFLGAEASAAVTSPSCVAHGRRHVDRSQGERRRGLCEQPLRRTFTRLALTGHTGPASGCIGFGHAVAASQIRCERVKLRRASRIELRQNACQESAPALCAHRQECDDPQCEIERLSWTEAPHCALRAALFQQAFQMFGVELSELFFAPVDTPDGRDDRLPAGAWRSA